MYHSESSNMDPSVKSVMAKIYEQLRSQPRIIARRSSPEPAVESFSESESTESVPLKEAPKLKKRNKKIKSKSKSKSKRITGGAAPGISECCMLETLPHIHADLETRHLLHMRRCPGPHRMDSFENQKRLREVLRQKRILEEMLNEHRKLQRDRQSIASEIVTMKGFLDSIRCKLDVSLRKLSCQKTFVERMTPITQATCRREIAMRYSPKLSIQAARQRRAKKHSKKDEKN